jgi:hypothetical protein
VNKIITRSGVWPLIFFALIACLPQSQARTQGPTEIQDLSFDTIDQGAYGLHYTGVKPAIFVIARVEDVDTLNVDLQFRAPLTERLRQLDYNRSFAVLVFYGSVRTGGYSIIVDKISKQDSQIKVRAQFIQPGLHVEITQGFTLPYHLVAVSKTEPWKRNVRFILLKEDDPVAETSHFIP